MNIILLALKRIALMCLVIATLTSCTELGNQTAEGGISGSGFSSGPISGLGSIISNRIKFNTDNVVVDFNGVPGTADQLEIGMVVTVNGDFDTQTNQGYANTVDFAFTHIGRINEIYDDSNLIVSMGQNIMVDTQTIFSNTIFQQLDNRDFIAISGLINSNGSLLATYVKKIPQQATVVVEGIVSNLNAGASTFRILNLSTDPAYRQLVDYSSAILNGFANAGLADGMLVRIEGNINGSVLNADSIRNKQDALKGAGSAGLLLQGLVTEAPSNIEFGVAGNMVKITSDTEYINTTLSGIILNDSILIVGSFGNDGSLNAKQVIKLLPPTIEIEANVDAIDNNTGAINLLGITLSTNLTTRFIDNSINKLQLFNIDNIVTGDRLIVKAFESDTGIVIAHLQRIDDTGTGKVLIQGPVSRGFNDPLLDIVGLSIDTFDLQDNLEFFEGNLIPISRNRFFGSLSNGITVKSTGTYSTSSFIPENMTLISCCILTALDSSGRTFGGIDDIIFNWDGSLYTDPVTQTTANMSMNSASNKPFFGAPFKFHDMRGFGPGDYAFTTTKGNTLTMQVGEGQIGAHLLYDYNGSNDIDMVLVWDINSTNSGPLWRVDDLVANGRIFGLAPSDTNGDGTPGIPMTSGPFTGFYFNFNLSIPPP